MKNKLSQVQSLSRACPTCRRVDTFKLIKVQFEPMGMGVLKLELWRCSKCHFESKLIKKAEE